MSALVVTYVAYEEYALRHVATILSCNYEVLKYTFNARYNMRQASCVRYVNTYVPMWQM